MEKASVGVVFVCLGNICRSPTAEGVMRRLVEEAGLQQRFVIDSSGTGAYHVGERADPRSRHTASARGIELTSVARQFEVADFERFDFVLAMDRQNLRNLEALARHGADRQRLHLLRSFDRRSGDELDVPDPYYGGDGGFDRVFDICEAGCRGLMEHILAMPGWAPRG